MPDAKQMSGIPRPVGVDELPNGSVSVRVVRGEITNNIPNQPVELQVGDTARTVRTDDAGRAQFDNLPAGSTIKALTVVDGERVESQAFPAPSQGGIRLLLVATDRERERQRTAEASAPAVAGQVTFGGESRIVIEPGDEDVAIYYMLEIVNSAATPVNPPVPLQFDMPTDALSTTIMRGSSPLASSTGSHVRVLGPFPPGKTLVEVGASLPVTSGTLSFDQTFPTQFDQLVVVAKKDGDLKLSSPQLSRIRDTAVEGTPVVIGAGGTIQPGQSFTITLSGLPHHSSTPRRVALTVAALIVLAGIFASTRLPVPAGGEDRKKLTARRERLLQDLVRLEHDRRRGRVDAAKYAERREELLKSLEQVYGALDVDDVDADPMRDAGMRTPLRPVGVS